MTEDAKARQELVRDVAHGIDPQAIADALDRDNAEIITEITRRKDEEQWAIDWSRTIGIVIWVAGFTIVGVFWYEYNDRLVELARQLLSVTGAYSLSTAESVYIAPSLAAVIAVTLAYAFTTRFVPHGTVRSERPAALWAAVITAGLLYTGVALEIFRPSKLSPYSAGHPFGQQRFAQVREVSHALELLTDTAAQALLSGNLQSACLDQKRQSAKYPERSVRAQCNGDRAILSITAKGAFAKKELGELQAIVLKDGQIGLAWKPETAKGPLASQHEWALQVGTFNGQRDNQLSVIDLAGMPRSYDVSKASVTAAFSKGDKVMAELGDDRDSVLFITGLAPHPARDGR